MKFFRAFNQITAVAVIINQVRYLLATCSRDCRISFADCHGVDAIFTRNVVAVNFKARKLRELRGVDCQLEIGALRYVLLAVKRACKFVIARAKLNILAADVKVVRELELQTRAVVTRRNVICQRSQVAVAFYQINAVLVSQAFDNRVAVNRDGRILPVEYQRIIAVGVCSQIGIADAQALDIIIVRRCLVHAEQ